MGVSGCGKSTLGSALAEILGWRFVEGDDLHPPGNIAKMAAGIPLEDEDRWPFLENVALAISEAGDHGIVAACSALKRRYRDLIRARSGEVMFVLPMLDRERLVARLALRRGHFMPPALLDSQLAELEALDPDERGVLVDAADPLLAQITRVTAALRAFS